MQHYLWPLLRPRSVVLVGASDKPRSLGRTVYENLVHSGFEGAVHAVNVAHRTVLDRPAFRSLADIGAPVDLAIIATPPAAVPSVLESAPAANVKVAVVMTAPPGVNTAAVRSWSSEVASVARRSGVRVIGPGALGIIRPQAHLNATFCAPSALPGRLALVAQSGAVAAAMLDFATPLGIGFSCVVSLGGGIDVGFGELLDLLLVDSATDGILLYIEDVSDTRSFMSALRAAARTKPVVVLKAGRCLEPAIDPSLDAVFDAALKRAGTVRVETYTQLFAAARILADGRIPHGDRLAIVSNGRGPALLAADRAFQHSVPLAKFTSNSADRLGKLLGEETTVGNPIDVRNAPPDQHAEAVTIALDDPNVDVVIALHVPRPNTSGIEAAQSLASVARGQAKPVLGAWLGAIDRAEVHGALEAGGVSDFFTPENAVDALSFLASYRNNQAWLLEVPSPQPEPEPFDLAPMEALRLRLVEEQRDRLKLAEASAVLATFGIGRFVVSSTLEQAEALIRKLRPPYALELDIADASGPRRIARSRRALAKAWNELREAGAIASPLDWNGDIVIREAPRDHPVRGAAIGIATDARFGPVIWLGPAHVHEGLAKHRSLMLPPLNARLAADLIVHAAGTESPAALPAEKIDMLVDALTRVSALACALPWIHTLVLDGVVAGDRFYLGAIAAHVDPQRKLMRGYPHMAIHPYPVELIGDVTLADGTTLHVRPIRPEDARLEIEFVQGLSEQTRYYRFFYRLNELTPAMLARFTQVDYDRELALVAVTPAGDGKPTFAGVARYIANPDRVTAEFAVVVADAWQRRGVARILMRGLIVCAKRRGFERLAGTVLRVNEPMIGFVRSLGFAVDDDPEDPSQVVASLALT